MTVDLVPSTDLVPSLASRVVTVNAVDIQEGEWAEDRWVRFRLVGDVHVAADSRIVLGDKGGVKLPLPEGRGQVRLPVWTDTTGEWAIEVTKSWAPHPYYIRVPAGTGSVDLSQINPLHPVDQAIAQWLLTNASVTLTEGAAWGVNVDVAGGNAHFDFTVPPGGEAWSKGLLTAATDRDALTPGVYRVQSASVATTIGLPVARVGTLEVLEVSPSSGVKVHRFTTNDVNNSLPLEVWVQATNQHGDWVRDWQQIYPVDLSPAQHYRGTLHAHLPGDPTTLDTGIYDLRSGSAATAWQLPVARAGVLEVVQPETGAGRFMRFTTNDTINLGLETWVRTPDQNSEWTRDWRRTYPPEEGGMTPGEVTGLIASELVPYATKAELAAAIAALPDPVTAFGVDPDGVPYLMIGE